MVGQEFAEALAALIDATIGMADRVSSVAPCRCRRMARDANLQFARCRTPRV